MYQLNYKTLDRLLGLFEVFLIFYTGPFSFQRSRLSDNQTNKKQDQPSHLCSHEQGNSLQLYIYIYIYIIVFEKYFGD